MEVAITLNFTDEQRAAMAEIINKAVDAIKEFWERIKEAIAPYIAAFSDFIKSIQKCAASPKSYHLAYNSKKARVRKKNRARIWEAIRRIIATD